MIRYIFTDNSTVMFVSEVTGRILTVAPVRSGMNRPFMSSGVPLRVLCASLDSPGTLVINFGVRNAPLAPEMAALVMDAVRGEEAFSVMSVAGEEVLADGVRGFITEHLPEFTCYPDGFMISNDMVPLRDLGDPTLRRLPFFLTGRTFIGKKDGLHEAVRHRVNAARARFIASGLRPAPFKGESSDLVLASGTVGGREAWACMRAESVSRDPSCQGLWLGFRDEMSVDQVAQRFGAAFHLIGFDQVAETLRSGTEMRPAFRVNAGATSFRSFPEAADPDLLRGVEEFFDVHFSRTRILGSSDLIDHFQMRMMLESAVSLDNLMFSHEVTPLRGVALRLTGLVAGSGDAACAAPESAGDERPGG